MYLIGKNILNKVYFHPLFIISIFISILLGKFRLVCYFMMLIIIHELGHILPFGGLTKCNIPINTPLIEEFLVAISGIIFQEIFYLIIKSRINYEYFHLINYFIIIFNLIPIYPLDGSKVLNVIFNKITNYKNSISLTLIFSYAFLILLVLFFYSTYKIVVIIMLFLFLEVNKLYKMREELFNKFILERYLKSINFKKQKIINNIHFMKKDYRHIFYKDGYYYTEKHFLRMFFDK